MTTKVKDGAIRPVNYLPPTDRQKAVEITNGLKNSKSVEEVVYYQKKLAHLLAKANRNKAKIDNKIRKQAMRLQRMNRSEIKSKFSELREKQDSDFTITDSDSESISLGYVLKISPGDNKHEGVKVSSVKLKEKIGKAK